MRILIATATAGAGHLQAAAALAETWKVRRPRDEVKVVDVLEFTPSLYRKAYSEGYARLVAKAPEVYGAFFRRSDEPRLMRRSAPLRRLAGRTVAPGFVRLVKEFRPRAVVCTHFLPVEILGGAGRPKGAPFLATVVTDYEAHAMWQDAGLDLTCVATPETKARLVARGVPAREVAVTGIPVSPRFAAAPSRRAARLRHGLRDDLPVLLVLAGGFGMGPLASVAEALQAVKRPLQLVVVCGRNEALRREVGAGERRHPMQVLGFTREMPSLMAAADLIVTKPGGLTVSEALAVGRPLLIINPIPGQEEANAGFLLEHGAAAQANRPEDLASKVEGLLSGGRLAALARAAKGLGRPRAAEAVLETVIMAADAS